MKYIYILLFGTILMADESASLLFNGNCIACHKETKEESAPSVVEFKKRYKDAFKTKKEFVEYMSKWVANPDEKTSLMDDAIKKHGLMPQLGFDEDTLHEITSYIYDTNFTKRGGRYWSH